MSVDDVLGAAFIDDSDNDSAQEEVPANDIDAALSLAQ